MSSYQESMFDKSADEEVYNTFNNLKKIIIYHHIHKYRESVTEIGKYSDLM